MSALVIDRPADQNFPIDVNDPDFLVCDKLWMLEEIGNEPGAEYIDVLHLRQLPANFEHHFEKKIRRRVQE